MRIESVSHLSDSTLERELEDFAAHDRGTTVRLLVRIAEFDVRRLHLKSGYASTYAYCVGRLKMSEDIACNRIRAARAARRFPFILHALADGRLRLSGVVMLAPRLTEATAEDLLAAALDKTNAEIGRLLAERFPKPDVPTLIVPLSTTPAMAPAEAPAMEPTGQLEPSVATPAESPAVPMAVPPTDLSAVRRIESPMPRAKLTPTSPGRYALLTPLRQETHDLLRYVQDLLGAQVAPGDVDAVLFQALSELARKLEQRKFAATDQPRHGRHAKPDSRHISAEVRRAVWKRDGGRCTFTSDDGHRCEERKDLEFDHIDPYARGGAATVSGVRLLCRAHNQYEAERAYGGELMRHKREAAKNRASERRARRPSADRAAG